jgi:large subunit ribosomal protein L15
MKLNELNRAPEAKAKKRVGRGPGSGMGKTATRGEKGQKARSGASIPAWFQGGQTPLYRRVPKRGFKNTQFRTEFATINLSDLNKFEDGAVVTAELLKEMGLLKNQLDGVKVLGNGTLEKKLTVKAHRFSDVAYAEIEKLGGKAEVI